MVTSFRNVISWFLAEPCLPCSGWQESLQRPHALNDCCDLRDSMPQGNTEQYHQRSAPQDQSQPPLWRKDSRHGESTGHYSHRGSSSFGELATRGEGRNRERRHQKTEEICQPFPPTDPDEYQFKVVRNHEPIYRGNPSSSQSRLQSRKAVCCSPCHLGLSAFVIKTY